MIHDTLGVSFQSQINFLNTNDCIAIGQGLLTFDAPWTP